jgi:hypothetical protein
LSVPESHSSPCIIIVPSLSDITPACVPQGVIARPIHSGHNGHHNGDDNGSGIVVVLARRILSFTSGATKKKGFTSSATKKKESTVENAASSFAVTISRNVM